jgi:hypothetical protein
MKTRAMAKEKYEVGIISAVDKGVETQTFTRQKFNPKFSTRET